MVGFLHQELTEAQREEIKAEAKGIIESFSAKLESISDLPEESYIESEVGYRQESEVNPKAEEFKGMILDNAKKKNEDAIIAEKKKW